MPERPLDALIQRPPMVSTPHQRAKAFYAQSVEVTKFSRESLVPIVSGILTPKPRERAAILLYGRMHGWAESMALFDRAMHFQAAAAGARSLFELLVDLLLLAADKDGKDVERYLCFPEVERFRVAQKRVRFREGHPDFDIVDPAPLAAFVATPGKEAEIDAIRLRLWGPDKHAKPKRTKTHWSGQEMPARVQRLGPRFESYYYELYSQLSWYVHGGSVGTAERPVEDFDNLLGYAHAYAQIFFLEAMATAARQLRLADAIPGFFAELNRLRDLPGIVLQHGRAAGARP